MISIDLLLANGATYKKVEKEEIIFQEGSHCCFYYQLVTGRVRWVNIDEDGNEFTQSIVDPGESFGEIPLFDHRPYAATAIADENSLIIRLSKNSFTQLLRENPELHFRFTALFAERLRFKFMMLHELSTHNPEQCITALINYFKETRKFTCPQCNKVTLTRQQIANMTGLRVETVIRTMRTLHEKGIVLIDKGKVYC